MGWWQLIFFAVICLAGPIFSRRMKVFALFLFSTICCCAALECFTEIQSVSGRTVGTSKTTCSKSTDYCYNATAYFSKSNQSSMVGCSTTRCSASQNKCINYTHNGHQVTFCCCNSSDLCNWTSSDLTFYGKVKQWFGNTFG